MGHGLMYTAKPRVSIVTTVPSLASCWTSLVSRDTPCAPFRARRAVSQNPVGRVSCFDEAMSAMLSVSAVKQTGGSVIRTWCQQGGAGAHKSSTASAVSDVSAFKAVAAVSCQPCQLVPCHVGSVVLWLTVVVSEVCHRFLVVSCPTVAFLYT